MLTVCKIDAIPGISLAHETVLRRENVKEFYLASEIVCAAHEQARKILNDAQAGADAIRLQVRRETSQQLWQQAQVLLDDWQSEREEMQNSVIDIIKKSLTQALHLAFATPPPESRIKILIDHLRHTYDSPTPAVLLVHPHQLDRVKRYLTSHSNNWKIVGDDNQNKDELCLKSSTGKFYISWDSVTEKLFSAVAVDVEAQVL